MFLFEIVIYFWELSHHPFPSPSYTKVGGHREAEVCPPDKTAWVVGGKGLSMSILLSQRWWIWVLEVSWIAVLNVCSMSCAASSHGSVDEWRARAERYLRKSYDFLEGWKCPTLVVEEPTGFWWEKGGSCKVLLKPQLTRAESRHSLLLDTGNF